MKLVPALIDATISWHESAYLFAPFLDALGQIPADL
jgi:hypothetical protein